jgi:ubiquinone/menaquinone biosynthesis C-methylase UbiE
VTMLDHAGCMACKKMFETEIPWLNPVLAQHIVRRVLSSGSTPKTIIDMGMGPGYLVKELAAITNARLIGVDCNPIMLELTQALLAAHAIPNQRVTLCLEDVHHLSFPDRFADVIVSFGCMHHWHDPVVGIRQCMRVLKPSGTLFL